MTHDEILAGRLAAQDRLIGLLLGIVMAAGAVTRDQLAELLEDAARTCDATATGRTEASILKSRADAVRKSG